jgi:hypothetical protein
VSFVDAQGATLGSPATQNPPRPTPLVVEPGHAVWALLTYSNAQAYPDSTCRPKQSSRLRVYPPGETVALLVADPVLVCSAPGTGQLHIGGLEPSG